MQSIPKQLQQVAPGGLPRDLGLLHWLDVLDCRARNRPIRPCSARRSYDGWDDPRPDDRSNQPELPKLLPGILAFPITLLRGVSDSGDDTVVGEIAIRFRGIRTSDDGLDRWSSGLVLGWNRLICSCPILRPWDNRDVAPRGQGRLALQHRTTLEISAASTTKELVLFLRRTRCCHTLSLGEDHRQEIRPIQTCNQSIVFTLSSRSRNQQQPAQCSLVPPCRRLQGTQAETCIVVFRRTESTSCGSNRRSRSGEARRK